MRDNRRSMNPTVSRLDREARRIGLTFVRPRDAGCNTRVFFNKTLSRKWVISPGGAGVLRVKAYVVCEPTDNDGEGWALDAEAVTNIERTQDIMYRAVASGCPVCSDPVGIECCEFGRNPE